MIPLWVTGDSLAYPDILADEDDFQTHHSEAQCLGCTPKPQAYTFYWECAVFATVASILQLHSETLHHHTHGCHLNILWTRCADIDWAENIHHALSLHYSLPPLMAGLICVDKGLDGRLWFGLYHSDSTIFIPTEDSVALESHHSSISMLNHLYSTRLTSTYKCSVHTSITHPLFILIITGPNIEWDSI